MDSSVHCTGGQHTLECSFQASRGLQHKRYGDALAPYMVQQLESAGAHATHTIRQTIATQQVTRRLQSTKKREDSNFSPSSPNGRVMMRSCRVQQILHACMYELIYMRACLIGGELAYKRILLSQRRFTWRTLYTNKLAMMPPAHQHRCSLLSVVIFCKHCRCDCFVAPSMHHWADGAG